MKKHLTLNLNDDIGKVLHITDTHLFTNDCDSLLGIHTNNSFRLVIDEIKSCQYELDLIVATGDFVQDGSKEAYSVFAHEINKLSIPCVWIPGNHDVYCNMESVFKQYELSEAKVILFGDKWVIILLNSQVEGQAYGLLNDAELAFLTSTLNQYVDRHAIIFLHHHPILSNCHWLDQHCLKNRDEFGRLVKKHKNIKSIGWGHIHQRLEEIWHKCFVFSTPSTCIQFKPECHDFCLSDNSPAWRMIKLHFDGQIETQVHYLNQYVFQPDMNQSGY